MAFNPFDVTIPHIFYACLGGFVVLFGMFSLFLREKLYVGEACWAFLFGVIIGPYGAGIFNPRDWGGASDDTTNQITLEFTRVVLAVGVFAIGVELPKAYMARHWKSLAFLLFPVMTWGWFVSAALIFALIPGLNFLSSLAVAACLTPTDPILAAAVVGGKYADKHVPAHLRHLLAAESGCNDGAAFPFLYIALYLILDRNSGQAIRDWFLLLWLYQVILGVVIGSFIGFGFRHLMKFCERNNLIDRQSYVAQYISLAILTIGVTTLLGSDDLLSAFACGTAFAWDGFFNKQTEESVFSSVIDLLFNVAAFVYVGAWMPFDQFNDPVLTLSPWRLIVIAVLILLLRRLPIMVLLFKWIPDVKTLREAIFSGHFGPIGVGGIFISTLAAGKLPVPSSPPANQTELLAATIQPIVAFMVLCSITIHGLSIPSFSLGRRVNTLTRTWSRHAAAPDWTDQARRVDRPEDIIINRDSQMERGELGPDEKLAIDSRAVSVTARGSPSPPPGSPPDSESETKLAAEVKMKEEYPPDGDENLYEWREGPHKVIERRAGPGEEVEVEVIKNAFAPGEAGPISSTFRSADTAVHRTRGAYMGKLKNVPHEVGTKVAEAEHVVSDDAKEVGNRVGHVMVPQSSQSNGEDEDDGWASDRSTNQQRGASISTTDGKKRFKSPKLKFVPKPVGKGRRRSSMRKGMLGRAHLTQQAQPETSSVFGESDEEEDRGRRDIALVEPKDEHVSRGSGRGLRLDLIRGIDARREDSPARSIRFQDEVKDEGNRSGTNTPRLSILHDSFTGSPRQGSIDDVDSSKNKVTFDLP